MTRAFWGRTVAIFGLSAAVAGTISWACTDAGYETSWDPKQSSAILSPANDTRSNLLLLLADRQQSLTANPAEMVEGIVPIEFPWSVMRERLPPSEADEEESKSIYYPSESDGWRCNSNRGGAATFAEAVNSDSSIPDADKAALIQARETLKAQCNEAATANLAISPAWARSRNGAAFTTYLLGAQQFYASEFAEALTSFRDSANEPQPWVREASTYMVARTLLNQAQESSFDEYGDLAEPAKRDQRTIDAAGQAFTVYLKAYPQGRYAGSARGLLRRVIWLKNDQQALGMAYSELLDKPAARDDKTPNTTLIEEIDTKLLPGGSDAGVTDPILLAVIDLKRLRQQDNRYYSSGPRMERVELERQRPIFKSNPALFDYLLAVEAFYGRKQPAEVLTLIPDAAHQNGFTYLQFSRQMLRGFALEAVKNRNAGAFWLSLLPGANRPYQREAVELALAEHDGISGQTERLLAAGSPIRHPLIRQHILEDDAGPALLRQQARSGISAAEREVSLYLLLASELHQGLYADFLKDVTMAEPRSEPKADESYGRWSVADYDPIYNKKLGSPPLHVFATGGSDDLSPCPNIRATATSLAANPAATRPRLCLAEFIRRKGFDGWNEQYDNGKMVIRARNGFPGKPLERIDIYRGVIASPTTSADDKAFALNRALRCFAPSGHSSCGGDDIPVEQRKIWFTQLKRDYPQSAWARDLTYYW